MLTRERLTELFTYDPETGLFRSTRSPHKTVGGRISLGYLTLFIDGKRRYCHRLAVLWMTGRDPEGQVDHINGDRADNHWSNLRVCEAHCQQWNMKKRKDGSSRFKGVTWNEGQQRWRANLRVNGKVIYGGVHLNEEAAAHGYDELARRHYGAFARVNFPREGEQPAHDRNIPPPTGETE